MNKQWRIVLFVVIAWVAHGLPCSGQENQPPLPEFSLMVEDEPLETVLKKISESTGYRVSVDEVWGDFPVTAKFNDLNILEGLKRILRGLNHVLLIDEGEKSISVQIHDDALNRATLERLENQAKRSSTRPEMSDEPADDEVIPPDQPGERGVTERALEAMEAEKEQVDPKDLEVIPPEHPGEKGMTERELELLEAGKKEEIDPLDLEVIPPEHPGEPGITERELIEMESLQREVDAEEAEEELIPPEDLETP